MKAISLASASAVATIIVVAGAITAAPLVFAGRALPGVTVAGVPVAGLPHDQLQAVLAAYEENLLQEAVTVELKGKTASLTLQELGVTIDQAATVQAIADTSLRDLVGSGPDITPRIQLNTQAMAMNVLRRFPDAITLPQNATLNLSGLPLLATVPARRGEQVDGEALRQELASRIVDSNWEQPVHLSITEQAPAVEDHEVAAARQFAETLLQEGLNFVHADQTFHLASPVLRRLLVFGEQVDPADGANRILGVRLDRAGLEDYLRRDVAPAINQTAVNARFTLSEVEELTASGVSAPPRVTQFALPKTGQTLDVGRSAAHAAAGLEQQERTFPLAVDISNPAVTDVTDSTQLGLTTLLAVGESDFAGSPKNRIHNITVGTARYHGLLIAPGQEFSFNEFLGPVTAAAGFLPELVIKHNVTTPEYGGGLCQVSTTAFRAALNAGLKITDRRNHAYAVRYYGTPGLDATIYPPSADLKFTNNTPAYILLQTRIEGTKLFFELWGTGDGREVQLAGPVTYDKEASGAVKAYVTQRVTRAGETIIDETFYSRYKSPKLFPKVLAANGEQKP